METANYSEEFCLEDYRDPMALGQHIVTLLKKRYPAIQVEFREIKDLRSAPRGTKVFLDFRAKCRDCGNMLTSVEKDAGTCCSCIEKKAPPTWNEY